MTYREMSRITINECIPPALKSVEKYLKSLSSNPSVYFLFFVFFADFPFRFFVLFRFTFFRVCPFFCFRFVLPPLRIISLRLRRLDGAGGGRRVRGGRVLSGEPGGGGRVLSGEPGGDGVVKSIISGDSSSLISGPIITSSLLISILLSRGVPIGELGSKGGVSSGELGA